MRWGRKNTAKVGSGPSTGGALDVQTRASQAMAREDRAGILLSFLTRLFSATAVGLWTILSDEIDGSSAYLVGQIAVFVLLGGIQLLLSRRPWYRTWLNYVFVFLDALWLSTMTLVPDPYQPPELPAAMLLKFPNFPYYFLVLGFSVFSFSPKLVVWSGLSLAGTYAVGAWWISLQPGSLLARDFVVNDVQDLLVRQGSPYFVDVFAVAQNGFVLVVTAAILATVVWRSRRLVLRQASVERQRANLARYFSPNLVDELANRDTPLATVRRGTVAALFVDMVGFTTLAEALEPEAVMTLLRDFHGRMEDRVFDCGGTLEKFIGDAMLATFGAPEPTARDPVNALLCARLMLDTLQDWNSERAAQHLPPIRIGIGLHYGTAVMGDIGNARSMTFAVIGDTVNLASRLQGLTRDFHADLVISAALLTAARQADSLLSDALASDIVCRGEIAVRGRRDTVETWVRDPSRPLLISPKQTLAALQRTPNPSITTSE
jgi:adenylate cyclase